MNTRPLGGVFDPEAQTRRELAVEPQASGLAAIVGQSEINSSSVLSTLYFQLLTCSSCLLADSLAPKTDRVTTDKFSGPVIVNNRLAPPDTDHLA